MNARAGGFDWDRGNRAKCRKHGLTIPEIETAFLRPLAVVPDPRHSVTEERFKAIGTTAEGRHIFVVFTFRERDGDLLIRPISARPMHRKEIAHYEKTIARSENR
jgi:uncharacterized protein